MKRAFVYLNVFLLSFWCFLFIYLQLNTYHILSHFLISLLSIDDSRKGIFLILFNKNIYFLLQWVFLLLASFQLFFLILLIKNPLIFEKLKEFVLSIILYPIWLWKSFKNLSAFEKKGLIVFLSISILYRLWLCHNTGVIYDEAYTYLAFTIKNPLLAACFYPTSNNHILFSHFTQVTKFLPFNILTNLRLTALIPNILAIVTLFFCLKKYASSFAVWCGTLLFSFSFPMVYYGFVARGYSLIVFFFIIGFFSLLQLIKNPKNNAAWYRLSLSCVLGFYTIPIYLYPFLSLFGHAFIYFIIKKNKLAVFKTVVFGFISFCLTLMLYSPVFIISGIKSVTNNKFVQSLSYSEIINGFIVHVSNSIQFISGNKYGFVFIILPLMFILFNYQKIKNHLSPSIFLLLLLPIFIFIHKILPVERTWIYILIPIIFILTIIINHSNKPVLVISFCIFYIFIISINWQNQMLWYDKTCKEDYTQGQYFSNFFHNKNVEIITSSRMNSYLKFNKILQSENWSILDNKSNSMGINSFYIFYMEQGLIAPIGLKKINTINNYELYQLNH